MEERDNIELELEELEEVNAEEQEDALEELEEVNAGEQEESVEPLEELEELEEVNAEELEDTEPEYGGADGRPYSEYEVVGTKETIRGDNGVLRIMHIKDDEPKNVKDEYKDRLVAYTQGIEAGGVFEDLEGEPLAPRVEGGKHNLTLLSIDSLTFLGAEDERLRMSSLELSALETSIEALGQIEPITVVPLGNPIGYEKDENGEDIEDLPLYNKYQVVHGRRRVEAMANLGYEYAEALIDTTLPRELLEFYQAMATTSKPLKFSETMAYVGRMRISQPYMSPDLLEASVGFKVGELPKAEFIYSQQAEFVDIYLDVDKGKLTIEQGFKKIEKELTKREKEEDKALKEELGGAEGQDVEDELRDKQNQGLSELDQSVSKQELGDRHILDTALRRSVEARDKSECQVCGYAHGLPERADNLKAHHMVAVQYGGSDSLGNLIMLCNNCHEEVHKYESGRQTYTKESFETNDEIKRIVVLGNILRRARTMAISYIRNHDENVARQMDAGKTTVGRALQKLNVDLGVERTFEDNSPYKEYRKSTADLDYGGALSGELGQVWEYDEEPDVSELDEELLEESKVQEEPVTAELDEELGSLNLEDIVNAEESEGTSESEDFLNVSLDDLIEG